LQLITPNFPLGALIPRCFSRGSGCPGHWIPYCYLGRHRDLPLHDNFFVGQPSVVALVGLLIIWAGTEVCPLYIMWGMGVPGDKIETGRSGNSSAPWRIGDNYVDCSLLSGLTVGKTLDLHIVEFCYKFYYFEIRLNFTQAFLTIFCFSTLSKQKTTS